MTSGDVSRDPLGYTGLVYKEQPRFIDFPRPPNNTDYQYEIGTRVRDTSSVDFDLYTLTHVDGTTATWQKEFTNTTVNYPPGILTGDGTPNLTGSAVNEDTVLLGDVSNTVKEATLTDGQLLIGSTGNTPASSTLTSLGGTLTITGGAGTLNAEATNPVSAIPVPANEGGTGIITPTTNNLLAGDNAAALKQITAPTANTNILGSEANIPIYKDLVAGTNTTVTSTATTLAVNAGESILKQQVYTSTNATTVITAQIPGDNTIPQSTEGTQILTVSITPSNAAHALLVQFTGFSTNSTNVASVAALFLNAETNARYAHGAIGSVGNNSFAVYNITYRMTALNTAAHIFRIRLGRTGGAGTVSLNGGTLGFGAVSLSTLTVSEIVV